MELEKKLLKVAKLWMKRKWKKAEKELKKMIEEHGYKPKIVDMLVKALLAQGKKKEAIQLLDKATEENPEDVKLLVIKEAILATIGKNKEARKILKKAYEIAKGTPEEATVLSDMVYYMEQEDLDKALEMVEDGLKKFPGNPELLERKAEILVMKNKLDEAEKIAKELLKKNHIGAYYILASIYHKRDDMIRARKYIEKAIKYDPANPEFLYAYADTLRWHDEFEKALEYVSKALEINPNYVEALKLKAELLMVTGRKKEALEVLEEAIRLNPNSSDLWGLKGVFLEILRRPNEALECYEKALSLDPSDWAIYSRLAKFYARKGDYDRAWEYFRKMEELGNPNDPGFWLSKGDFLKLVGRREEALRVFREALRRFSNNPSYRDLFKEEIEELSSS